MKITLAFSFIFISIIFIIWATFINRVSEELGYGDFISPLAQSLNAFSKSILPLQTSELSEKIENLLDDEDGRYSMVVKNLKTGELFTRGAHEKYEAASLYKLWVMGTAYEQIVNGTLKKNELLSNDVAELNDTFKIATEEAELTDGHIERTVESAIEDMITVSHNYAALLLASRVKISNMSKFMKKYGFLESHSGSPPTTTAFDTASYFERLYKGEIVNKKSSSEMVEILKRQQLNDRIPKYLPKEIGSAHKTGELNGDKHDAGIVFTDKGDYILVLMSETDDPSRAAEVEAQISREVYNYFIRNTN